MTNGEAPAELFLRGRLQVETARDALAFTRLNPAGQNLLGVFISVHAQLSDGTNQNDAALVVYLEAGETEQIRADVVQSLGEMACSQAATEGQRVAANILLGILQSEEAA